MHRKYSLEKAVSILVITAMILGCMSLPWAGITQAAYAKEIGQKNEQALAHCQSVLNGSAPEGYSGVPGTEIEGSTNFSVYSGGNSSTKANGTEIDSDPTDFASPLPYGNVFVDVTKLKWDDPKGFVIDIKDDRFQWVTIEEELTDAENHKSTTDPMSAAEGIVSNDPDVTGVSKPLKFRESVTDPDKTIRGIYYVGPLTSYLPKITDPVKAPTVDETTTNVIEPAAGKPYLYRINYKDAVVLPDGTRGDLLLTMKKIQIETSATVDSDHPYTPDGAAYSYTKALLEVQGENCLSNDTGYEFCDKGENDVNQRNTEIMTATQAKNLLDKINGYLLDKAKAALPDTWAEAKSARNAMGNILDLDIEVIDEDGHPVQGTISYAAHDMDFESAQNVWGRPVGDEFSEALTIVSGSQSYAVVPDYSKLVKQEDGTYKKVFYKDDAAATSRETGWAPSGPGQPTLTRVLDITKKGTGSHADGVRFASPFLLNYRDANGKYDDVIYNTTAVTSFQGDGSSANNNTVSKKSGNSITNVAKKQLYAKLCEKAAADNVDPYVATWKDVTPELAWKILGNNSWKTYRNDDNTSFDSGFAVLLDAKKSSIQWSGSRATGANLHTTLFDPTVYTYIEQTHGTGGGIYLESYDLSNDCAPTPMEGVVTMARYSDATVTAVPEDGYRVKTLMVGGTGLTDPVTYNVDELEYTDNKYKDDANGVIIEKNPDGSYDVTVTDLVNPRHVHADFTADYYFYKVWKTPKGSSVEIPKTLELTATPFVFQMTSVTVGGVTYTITDEGSTYTANGKKHYMTANSTVTLGGKVYTLVGNKLVDSDENEYTIATSTVKGNTKTFTVSSTGKDVEEGFVTVEEDSDGNTVWKIKYPEEGREATTGTWPALPIETYDGAEHNYNHVQRNYWFATETVPPAWTEGYDNSTALAPGIVTAEDGKDTLWKARATTFRSSAQDLIASKEKNNYAFMSPLSTAVTHNDTTYTGWGGEISNEITPPEGTPKETYGAKNQPQYADGKSMFEVTTDKAQDGSDNEIVKVELIGEDGKPAKSVKVEGGTYTIDSDGVIKFTPDKDFVGDPPPVTVRGTDKNGLSAETTYTPHVRDVIKTVTRTIVYEYEDGTPVKDADGNPLTVEQTVRFEGTINPDTGEVVYPAGSSGTMEAVPSDEINGYNVDRETVGEAVVYPNSNDLFEKVIYSPKGIKATADETYGLPNTPQTGSPKFEMETPECPDGTPNELTVKLVDPKTGKATDAKTVSAVDEDGKVVGTYTLNPDGTTTFTPNDGYVGNPRPLELEGTDKLGNVARTTYTPHIVDPVDQDTATRTIHYTYLTKDGKKVTGDTTQTAVLHRHAKSVDPKTGEVLQWSDWEPATFPAVKSPDDKVNGKIWFTDDSAGEQTVTKPGRVPDLHIVYQKLPYTVKYLNGLHGKSDGKGDQKGVPYGDMVKGGNSVTPNSGYKFTGKYTYVIKDRDGNIIKTGETDDPKSVEVIGNVEFTPIYKKLPTTIYVDPATGRTVQKTLPFLDENTEPDPPADPERDGYKFVGWDRIEEFDKNGELVSVRYEAKWKKIKPVSASTGEDPGPGAEWDDPQSGDSKSDTSTAKKGTNTGDTTHILLLTSLLLAAVITSILVFMRRRRYNR